MSVTYRFAAKHFAGQAGILLFAFELLRKLRRCYRLKSKSLLFSLVVCQIDAGTYKKQPEDETRCELLSQDNDSGGHAKKW